MLAGNGLDHPALSPTSQSPLGLGPMGLGLRGKVEGEGGAGTGGIAGEVAVVLLGDAERDGESEAVAGFGGVEPDEAFENAFALVYGYARAVVCNPRFDESVEPS